MIKILDPQAWNFREIFSWVCWRKTWRIEEREKRFNPFFEACFMKLWKILREFLSVIVNRKYNNLRLLYVTFAIAIKFFCHIFLKKVDIFDLNEKNTEAKLFHFIALANSEQKANKRLKKFPLKIISRFKNLRDFGKSKVVFTKIMSIRAFS